MKRLALLLPLFALAAAQARAEDPATNAAVVWVSRIPLDGSGPRYESVSGLPGRYRLGTLDDGGTYSGVARLFFGSASAWPAIHEANRDRFPDPARVPAEADLAVPAPAAALPPAAPGLAASISLASVERRLREGIAEDADPDFREKTHLRFRLSLTNETDRTIAVSFYKEFKSSFPGEPSAWFSGFCTFDDAGNLAGRRLHSLGCRTGNGPSRRLSSGRRRTTDVRSPRFPPHSLLARPRARRGAARRRPRHERARRGRTPRRERRTRSTHPPRGIRGGREGVRPVNPPARERRSRDTRTQPAWRHPATPCNAARSAKCHFTTKMALT